MTLPDRIAGTKRRRAGVALVAVATLLFGLMVAGRFATLGYLGKRIHVGTTAGSFCVAFATVWDGQHWFANSGWFAYSVNTWDWWRWTVANFTRPATPGAPAYGPACLVFMPAWVFVAAVGLPGALLWRRGAIAARV